MGEEWWQVTTWDAENEAEFEKHIARARYQKQFYLYSQGYTLTASSLSTDRAAGRNLLRRAVDEPVGFSRFNALDALAQSLIAEGDIAEGLNVRNHARLLRAALPSSRRDDIAIEALEYAEALFAYDRDGSLAEIERLLDEAIPELEAQQARPPRFRARLLHAQVRGLRGDVSAGRVARTLLSDLREVPELFEQWLNRSSLGLEADLVVISDAFPAADDEPPPAVLVESDYVGLVRLRAQALSGWSPAASPVDEALAMVLLGFNDLPHLDAKLQIADIYRATEFLRRHEGILDPAELEVRLSQNVASAQSAREYWADAVEVMRELRDAGFGHGVDEPLLSYGRRWDSGALPILTAWIDRSRNKRLRQGLLAILDSNSWAKPGAAQPLIDTFRSIEPRDDPDPYSLRSSIAHTISRTATEKVYDDILALALEPSCGESRRSFIEALGRMRKHREQLVPVVMGLLRDEASHVFLPSARVLAQWRVAEARPVIERLISSVDQRNPGTDQRSQDLRAGELHQLRLALKRFA